MNKTYYGGFYGLDSAPFHITPDPSRLFLTQTHEHALGAIEYGITAAKGFIVVTGEVGVGKTTVLRSCLDRLDAKTTRIIYLFNPALSTAELYATVLDELDGKRRRLPAHPSETLQTLQRKLLAAYTVGKHIVLAVDEAQNMPEATLESLRMLSNLETSQSKLLQIVLVGQPELETLLAKHSLRQLTQRVAVRARIKRLSFRQSCRYIEHRTRCAGLRTARPLFTAPAQWYIALLARGIPRTINICCDNALINGYGHSAPRISLRIAREACRPLGYHLPLKRALGAAAALALVLCGVIYGNDWLRHAHALDVLRLSAVHAAGAPPRAAQATARSAVTASATVTPASAATPAAPAAAPAVVPGMPPAAPAPEEHPSAAAPPADAAAPAPSQWHVREGDTVYGACVATYGTCDEKALRAVLASNPQIDAHGLIHRGEVINMPGDRGAARTD